MNNPATPPPIFKDRSAGLFVFGLLTILGGVVNGLMVPSLIGTASINAANGTSAGGFQTVLPALSVFLILAIANIWLGIGSILKRRWARALLLISSWFWLIFGSLTTATMLFVMPVIMKAMPQTGETALSPGVLTSLSLFPVGFCFVTFVLVPLTYLLFYRSPHVRATCEAASPTPCWTDTCPLPVLALALWLGAGTPCLLLVGLFGSAPMPLFGLILSGWTARLLCLALAALWGWLAWNLYRLSLQAWWITGLVFLLYMVSSVLTFSLHSLGNLYDTAHVSGKEAQAILDSPLMHIYLLASPVFFTLLLFGYLLFIRKYFVRPSIT